MNWTATLQQHSQCERCPLFCPCRGLSRKVTAYATILKGFQLIPFSSRGFHISISCQVMCTVLPVIRGDYIMSIKGFYILSRQFNDALFHGLRPAVVFFFVWSCLVATASRGRWSPLPMTSRLVSARFSSTRCPYLAYETQLLHAVPHFLISSVLVSSALLRRFAARGS